VTGTCVEFRTSGRHFKSSLETGGPSGPFFGIGDPGDPLRDALAEAIAAAWKAVDCDKNALHDHRFKVAVSLFPSTLTLTIRPIYEKGN
jgi:hypothetical protein